jgi:xanthine dehydrogenase small subunit
VALRFVCDGELVALDSVAPGDTVLDFLRAPRPDRDQGRLRRRRLRACTVLVGTPVAGEERLVWRAVNACIQFLPMLHGKAVLTVNGLGDQLTPLQQTMACNGASQCGFCTPGFVMSLHGRAIGAVGADLPVGDVLAGNLCRCTGYGPLLEAGERHPALPHDDRATLDLLRQAATTGPACGHATLPGGGTARWFIPDNADALATLLAQYPGARIVAGATDVGLWVTKKLVDLDTVIFVGDVPELNALAESADGLTIGGAVRYADAHAALARLSPELGELVRRIGGLQVRNAGTIGGNIANGSPIGDGPPALIALGATLTCVRRAGGGRCRWKTSSWPMASRTGRATNSSKACSCRVRKAGISCICPSFPSVSTAISRLCAARFGCGWNRARSRRRVWRSAAWRQPRAARRRPKRR